MSWRECDLPVVKQVGAAYNRNDVDEMRRLLTIHPEVLRQEDGRDYWLGRSAAEGRLELVQMLVQLGIGVNESDDFTSPEGSVWRAAAEGHVEVVRWMLDHGAEINFTVDGHLRCFALSSAARGGHLETVKLLVQRGAAVNGSWAGMNPLMQAVFFGHREVADYLRAAGAKDLRETQPPDYAACRTSLLRRMVNSFGPLSSQAWHVPGDPDVTIHLIPANEETPEHTLFTIGLSDHRLPNGIDLFAATELKLNLPREWPLTAEALADPEWNWPLEWLKRVAIQLRQASEMPSYPILFLNDGNPPRPLTSSTRLCGWLCVHGAEGTGQMPDYRWIGFCVLFAIYPEEIDVIRTQGLDEFIERLQANDIRMATIPDRPNVGK